MLNRKSDHHPFHQKVCVITGAASGIGRAIAGQLYRQGAVLAISDIDEAGLEETKKSLNPNCELIRTHQLNVADGGAVEAYADSVQSTIGDADYVFNVAGLTTLSNFAQMPIASFEKVMDVNFWGTVRMTKAFLPQLISTKGGVINISSLFGLVAFPGQSHYCASKFAVRGFSETLSVELYESGVSVTSVHPGGVATNIVKNAVVDAPTGGINNETQFAKSFEKVAATSAEEAASQILNGAARRARRVVVGRDAKFLSILQRLFPTRYRDMMKRLTRLG